MTAPILPADAGNIAKAAELLRTGKLVAFPTETVYGLGADATNDRAVASIYAAKGRPQFNPLIVHVADVSALDDLVEWNETAKLLAGQFWPGPLTLVLKRTKNCPVSLLASAGMDTLAVRVPSHPVAQQLLREVKLPIAAPSANASGKLSPTAPTHVAESLGDKVDAILAGGKSQIGLESTVLDLTAQIPTILRPGGVTREQLERLLKTVNVATGSSEQPLSPGMLASHYAPNLPLRLNATSVEFDEALLVFGPDVHIKGGAERVNLSPQGDLNEAAANLFAMLRRLDNPKFKGIAVTPIPETGLGVAINDRLKRASVR
jgi:L-threonylcarbamoyladenylate synthase